MQLVYHSLKHHLPDIAIRTLDTMAFFPVNLSPVHGGSSRWLL